MFLVCVYVCVSVSISISVSVYVSVLVIVRSCAWVRVRNAGRVEARSRKLIENLAFVSLLSL